MNNLIAAFNQYFKLVHADNPQLLREAFRLRYQVYCEDTHFFDQTRCPEGLENDQYDGHSVHVLLQHRPSGYYVGTMRLVLPNPSDLLKPFPIEAAAQFDAEFPGVSGSLRRHTAEISRFAILHHFPHHQQRRRVPIHPERRRVPRYSASEKAQAKPRLRFPHPILALIFGLLELSVEHQITHWYAIMAPGLDRLLTHFSLNLPVVGPTIEMYGERRPHFCSIQAFLENAYCMHPAVWELVTDSGRLWSKPTEKTRRLIEPVT